MTLAPRLRRLAAPLAASLLAAGALVLTAAPAWAGAVPVGTEAELRDAFDNASAIALTNDITLTDCDEGDVDRTNAAAGPLTLDGQGFAIIQTCVGSRVLDIENDNDATLMNVTITGGASPEDGGGLDIDNGFLTSIDSQFLDNCAHNGGAVEHEGAAFIGTTIAGNTADGDGGAYSDGDGDSTTFVNSTITGNTSGDTGAIDEDGDGVTLTYVTIASNVFDEDATCVPEPAAVSVGDEPEDDAADGDDGDVSTDAFPAANITNAEGGAVTSFASVVALPVGGDNCDIGQFPTVSLGYNYSDDDSCGFTGTGDTQGGADPQLGELAANGGPTLTRLPAATSPLLDRVPLAECTGPEGDITTDQRGVSRPQGTGCDIGAVEIQPVPPAPEPIVLNPTFTG